MKKRKEKWIAFLLGFAMVLSLVTNSNVKAEGNTIERDGIVYTRESVEDPYVYRATDASYEAVTVPSGCIFEIYGTEVTINSLTMESEGEVAVLDDGAKLTIGGTPAFANDARMGFAGSSKIPDGMAIWDDGRESEITNTSEIADWISCFYSTVDSRWHLVVDEGETIERDGITYTKDPENDIYVYHAESRTYDTVTIPAKCIFEIAGVEVTINSLTMESEGEIAVLDDGAKLTIGGTPTFANDARMNLAGCDKIPDGMVIWDGDREITKETADGPGWISCHYSTADSKWHLIVDEPGAGEDDYWRADWTRLKTEMVEGFFAYGDWNNDASVTVDDLEAGWCRMLYDGFKVGEGRNQREGALLGLERETGENTTEVRNRNLEVLKGLTTVEEVSGESISVKDKSGTAHELTKYKATMTITGEFPCKEVDGQIEYKQTSGGVKEFVGYGDTPVVITAYIYMIEEGDCGSGKSREQVIIKVGNEYFIRNASYGENADMYSPLEDVPGTENDTKALTVVSSQFTGVDSLEIFGNNVSANYDETLSDASAKNYFVVNINGGNKDQDGEIGGKVAIYSSDFAGVTIKGKGESLTPLEWSVNTSYSIIETGGETDKTETSLFFGYNTLTLDAVSDGAITDVTSIKEVSIEGEIPETAVKPIDNGDGTFDVKFLSDYYDCVTVKVTYATSSGDEVDKYLTINRVGIVVKNGMTPGNNKTALQIMHGHDSGNNITNGGKEFGYAIYATYYYPSSAGVTTAGDTSLYVTLTYKDGTTKQQLITEAFFTPASAQNSAMSDFVIYVGEADDSAPVKVEAIAVENKGTDGRFKGAKLGAGKGVAKDIVIEL